MSENLVTIPARKGKAVRVPQGGRIKVVNIHGTQVVDTWAFNAAEMDEFMSMEHTRTGLMKVFPGAGDALFSNRRRPIVTMVEDTSPGVHDTLLAACDRYRYEMLGCPPGHDNCTDNLRQALAELGLEAPETPSPLNLWMNIPLSAAGGLDFQPPECRAGDYVVFAAEIDVIMAFSCCPQDKVPINGVDCIPRDAHFQLM